VLTAAAGTGGAGKADRADLDARWLRPVREQQIRFYHEEHEGHRSCTEQQVRIGPVDRKRLVIVCRAYAMTVPGGLDRNGRRRPLALRANRGSALLRGALWPSVSSVVNTGLLACFPANRQSLVRSSDDACIRQADRRIRSARGHDTGAAHSTRALQVMILEPASQAGFQQFAGRGMRQFRDHHHFIRQPPFGHLALI
jgi:hypothetical protein